MRLAAVIIYAIILLGASVGGLKCFNCHNCAKFEGSQSVPCGTESTRCLKLHHQSGQISRECSTESKCGESAKTGTNPHGDTQDSMTSSQIHSSIWASTIALVSLLTRR